MFKSLFKKIFSRKTLETIWSKKIYVIIALIILGLSGYYLYKKYHNPTQTTYQTATVEKGTLSVAVSGTGNISVGQEAKVNSSVSGKVTSLKVASGDQVKKGQFLFYVDNPQIDIDLTKSYASYIQAHQSLGSAQAALLQSELDLANLTPSSDVTKAMSALGQANQTVESAYASLLQAQSDYKKLIDAAKADPTTVSSADLKNAKEKAEVANMALTNARNSLTNAKNDYNQATANVSLNNQIQSAKVSASQNAYDAASQNVDAALASYNYQKDQAAERSVVAPIAGTITTLNIKNGDQVNSGSTTTQASSTQTSSSSSSQTSSSSTSASSSNSGALVIDDISTLKATVAINEVDIPKVTKDQKATMTFDAIANLTQTGKVEQIDMNGTNSSNVVTYSVTLGFDSLDGRIRPQMSVSADIITDVKQDVLTVPNAAVKTSGNSHYVQLLTNGTPSQQTVEVGLANDTETEITSGLNVGDVVITQTISPTATSSSSSSRGIGGGGARGIGL